MASLIVDQVDHHHDEQVINSIQNRKLSFTNAIPEIKDEPVINVEPSSDDFYEENDKSRESSSNSCQESEEHR